MQYPVLIQPFFFPQTILLSHSSASYPCPALHLLSRAHLNCLCHLTLEELEMPTLLSLLLLFTPIIKHLPYYPLTSLCVTLS